MSLLHIVVAIDVHGGNTYMSDKRKYISPNS
jgi:hypothetical protein